MPLSLLFSSLLAAVPARAWEVPAAWDKDVSTIKKRGWEATDSSLLLRNEKGEVVAELGVGRARLETGPGQVQRRTTRGGVSKDGRFAWHWSKEENITATRVDTVTGWTAKLKYYGTSGQVLWETRWADAPDGMKPVAQSDDGEMALVIEHRRGRWNVAFMTFTGNRLAEIKGLSRLEKVALTPKGRYGLALTGEIDKPLSYTFVDIRKKVQRTVPASDFLNGTAVIGDDGSVGSEKEVMFKFE